MKDINETILGRVRKLLAMSRDTSSPNEAAIAARRARALMDKHQLTELELEVDNADAADMMGVEDLDLGMSRPGPTLEMLAVTVAKLNDCQVIKQWTGRRKLGLRFMGLQGDAACAVELYKYLKAEMYRQAELNAEGRANRNGYRLGFYYGVQHQVHNILRERQELKTSNGKALVVCKQALVEEHFGRISYRQSHGPTTSADHSAINAGYERGKSTSLNRQLQ